MAADPKASKNRKQAPKKSRDWKQLQALSVVYYVFCVLTGFGFCTILPYFGIFFVLLRDSARSGNGGMASGGVVFLVLASLVLLAVGASAALFYFACKFLSQVRRRRFCLVVAGITCLFVPLGTILGVFTFIVLSRPSVKALFAKSEQRLEAAPDSGEQP